MSTNYCYSTSLRSALPGLQLLARPLCHGRVQQRSVLAALRSDLWGPLFLWRLLAETQRVTKPCGFGEGTGLSHLQCTAGIPPPQPVESLGPPCPAEVSHAERPECDTEQGTFGACLPGKHLSGNQTGRCWVVWLHRRGTFLFPCKLSLHYPRKVKKYPYPSYRLWAPPPMGDRLDLPPKSQNPTPP